METRQGRLAGFSLCRVVNKVEERALTEVEKLVRGKQR